MTPRATTGFSLVELLVVIAIVGVLVGFMLPALTESRAAALQVRCQANQKQIFPGVMFYIEDNKGWLPTSSRAHSTTGPRDAPNWAGITAFMLGFTYTTEYEANATLGHRFNNPRSMPRKNGILQCPADNYEGYWGAPQASTSYAWNNSGWGLGRNDVYTTVTYRRVRSPEVERPATTIMLGDFIPGPRIYYEYQANQLAAPTVASNVILHGDQINLLWADGAANRRNKFTLTADDFDRRK